MKQPTLAQTARLRQLLPNNYPRYVRIYDLGPGVSDQYTVVFTGRYNNIGKKPRERKETSFWYLAMSSNPLAPNGFCLLNSVQHRAIDLEGASWPIPVKLGQTCHLGKRIQWHDLPPDCQKAALHVYKEIWDLYPCEAKNGKIHIRGAEGIGARRTA